MRARAIGRAGVLAMMLIAVAACEREPSFDDRYDSAQETIEAKARELDAEIARDEAAAAARVEPEQTGEPNGPDEAPQD